MKLAIITITYNGFPWLPCVFAELNRSELDWHYFVVEGLSNNGGSTRWCKPQAAGPPSTDGSHEFLKSIGSHSRVRHHWKTLWPSKDAMVNWPIEEGLIPDDCVLMQIDSDELHSARQLRDIVTLFEINPKLMRAEFRCSYFVGPDLYLSGDDDKNTWLRAWRYRKGMRFDSHEPPVLSGNKGEGIEACMTEAMGLRFDHMAWVTEEQVRFKSEFYGYTGGLAGWKALQQHKKFPVEARHYLTWMIPGTMVNKLP